MSRHDLLDAFLVLQLSVCRWYPEVVCTPIEIVTGFRSYIVEGKYERIGHGTSLLRKNEKVIG